MKHKKIENIVKGCGLSVSPTIDENDATCKHYHKTDCIIQDAKLENMNLENVSLTEVTKKIDKELGDLKEKLQNVDESIEENKYISYGFTTIKSTLLNTLMTSQIELLNSEENILPKYLEIKSLFDLDNIIDINAGFEMLAYNNSDELVYSVDLGDFDKIKKLYVFKNIDIPNQWDDVKKIVVRPKDNLMLQDNTTIEIKLYYNKDY